MTSKSIRFLPTDSSAHHLPMAISLCHWELRWSLYIIFLYLMLDSSLMPMCCCSLQNSPPPKLASSGAARYRALYDPTSHINEHSHRRYLAFRWARSRESRLSIDRSGKNPLSFYGVGIAIVRTSCSYGLQFKAKLWEYWLSFLSVSASSLIAYWGHFLFSMIQFTFKKRQHRLIFHSDCVELLYNIAEL